jgi:hypothetical protein
MKEFLEQPAALTTASKYTALNGVAYLAIGMLLIVWPGAAQTLFMEPAFVGREEGLMRVIGLTIVDWVALLVRRSFGRTAVRRRFRY